MKYWSAPPPYKKIQRPRLYAGTSMSASHSHTLQRQTPERGFKTLRGCIVALEAFRHLWSSFQKPKCFSCWSRLCHAGRQGKVRCFSTRPSPVATWRALRNYRGSALPRTRRSRKGGPPDPATPTWRAVCLLAPSGQNSRAALGDSPGCGRGRGDAASAASGALAFPSRGRSAVGLDGVPLSRLRWRLGEDQGGSGAGHRRE